jgi:hypothetical protein
LHKESDRRLPTRYSLRNTLRSRCRHSGCKKFLVPTPQTFRDPEPREETGNAADVQSDRRPLGTSDEFVSAHLARMERRVRTWQRQLSISPNAPPPWKISPGSAAARVCVQRHTDARCDRLREPSGCEYCRRVRCHAQASPTTLNDAASKERPLFTGLKMS